MKRSANVVFRMFVETIDAVRMRSTGIGSYEQVVNASSCSSSEATLDTYLNGGTLGNRGIPLDNPRNIGAKSITSWLTRGQGLNSGRARVFPYAEMRGETQNLRIH